MRHFITGLQFLTRIRIFHEHEWLPESFGKSVKFFPLVGAVIGFFLAGFAWVCVDYLPPHTLAVLLLFLWIFLTGGLHCDGLMDTADGVLSGRPRDRMLEIMKDSRVGATGVMVFGVVLVLKFSLLADMPPAALPPSLFVATVAGRLAMTLSVVMFPYARPDGIGKAFQEFAGKNTGAVAAVLALLLILPLGKIALFSALGGVLAALLLAFRLNKVLGGLTGDVYGAVTECCEVVALLLFLLLFNANLF